MDYSIAGRWFILAVHHDDMTDAEWVDAGAGDEPDWSVVDTDWAEPGDCLVAERFVGGGPEVDVESLWFERRFRLLAVPDYGYEGVDANPDLSRTD